MAEGFPMTTITGEQLRAARAMLRLDQKQFAALTHMTLGAIRRLERSRGPVAAAPGVIEALRQALEAAGVEIIDAGPYTGIGGPGLRLRGEPVAADVIDLETEVEERAPDEIAVRDRA